MNLWLVCFLILFFSVEGLQWLGQLHWLSGAELSLPMVVLGGVGLAIASNYRWRQAMGLLSPGSSQPLSASPPPLPCQNLGPDTPLREPQTLLTSPQLTKKQPSISFQIRKPQG